MSGQITLDGVYVPHDEGDTMSRGTTNRTIRVHDELWDTAQAKAQADGTTLSDLMRAALEQYVTRNPAAPASPTAVIQAHLAAADSKSDLIARINQLRGVIAEHSPFRTEPVDYVQWIPADAVTANDYNPNTVAPPEMELLRHSITRDGYTQPIVTMPTGDQTVEVIDGFHRNRVGKECPDVRARVHGYLPIVTIRTDRREKSDRIAATIRHNRARGKHRVDAMSDIVIELKSRNWSDERIAKELGMEPDEVLRLCQMSGMAELFSDEDFSASWDVIGPDTETDQFEELDDTAGDEGTGLGGNRIYHTFDKWECYPAGFYESAPKERNISADMSKYLYARFLRDTPRFEQAMEGVLRDWPNSCEHYLSNERMNRIAWLGQAAACYDVGIPASMCNGFNQLTDEEQETANLAALRYLNKWLEAHGREPLATLKDAERKTQPELY